VTLTDSPEEAAFIAAVNAQPTDDLPRLIYADWLEEAGFAERAEQIRLQIALAQAKPWDAISIQHLRLDLGSYRRGFPYRMTVYDIPTLIRTLRSNAVPIGAIDIGTCPLNHWEELVALPEFQRIEEIRFTGLTLPIEPLRALRDAPNACNVTTLIFNRSNSLAFPEMIRELYLFPLGPQLKRLEIHFGQSGNEEDLFEAMTEHGQPIALEDFRYAGPLSLHRMNQRDGFLKVVRQVKRLELPGSTLGIETLFDDRVHPLEFLKVDLSLAHSEDWLFNFAGNIAASHLRWVDLRKSKYFEDHDVLCDSWQVPPNPVLNIKVLRISDFDSVLTDYNKANHPSGWHWLDVSTYSPFVSGILVDSNNLADDLIRYGTSNSLVRLTIASDGFIDQIDQERLQSHFGDKLELLERATGGIEV
jgi:uncharacterized protein (TIGR02996 family)